MTTRVLSAATLTACALLLVFAIIPAHANDIPVSPTCTIIDAITAANTDAPTGGCPAGSGADTVILESDGLYMLTDDDNSFGGLGDNGLPPITSTMTISGNGASILRSSNAPKFRILFIDGSGNLSLAGVTIGQGSAGAGGAIFNESGRLTLLGSRVVSNTAKYSGGGIYSGGVGASLVMKDQSLLAGNVAEYGGGLFNAAAASIEGSRVVSNTAEKSGGGIYSSASASLVVKNQSQLAGNEADYGGGIFNAADAMLAGSQILSNTASSSGGGIFNEGPTGLLTVTAQSLIAGNAAISTPGKDTFGGGISNFQATATITDSILSSNSAKYGGGLDNYQGQVLVTDSSLLSNTATVAGGGVYNIGTSALITLTRVHLFYNEASATGSALYHDGVADGGRIHDGCVVFNSGSAVQVGGSGSVDAANTWWGHPSGPSGVGPGIGDAVGVNVLYADFLTNAPSPCPTAPSPDMRINKSVEPAVVTPGEQITYTVVVANVGAAVATGVVISDRLPVQFTVSDIQLSAVGAGITITQARAGSDLHWYMSDLPIGAGGVITLTGTITNDRGLIGSPISNTGFVTALGDLTPDDNSSTAQLFIAPPPGAYLPMITR